MSYLIKDTTIEERKNIVDKALAILFSGAGKPSSDVLELANEYINGNIELDKMQELIIKKYTSSEDGR